MYKHDDLICTCIYAIFCRLYTLSIDMCKYLISKALLTSKYTVYMHVYICTPKRTLGHILNDCVYHVSQIIVVVVCIIMMSQP